MRPRPSPPPVVLRRAVPLLAAATLAACTPDPTTAPSPAASPAAVRDAAPVASAPREPQYVGAVRRRLKRAAYGLLFTSESDYPFAFYHRRVRAKAPLSVAAFRAAAGVPADSLVEEVSLDDFLARHIERVDPNDAAAVALVPRYAALKRELRTSVREPRVFRVGRVVVWCYLVGVDAFGNVTGLETVAIET